MLRAYKNRPIIGAERTLDEKIRLPEEQALLHTWGRVIRRYREWKRLSRRELAMRAGLSPVFLGEIERGEKDPSSHSLCAIASALDTQLSDLYMRVAMQLGTPGREARDAQPSLPLVMREGSDEYMEGVNPERDETAFDLYRVARALRPDQQMSLLMLAQTLAPADPGAMG